MVPRVPYSSVPGPQVRCRADTEVWSRRVRLMLEPPLPSFSSFFGDDDDDDDDTILLVVLPKTPREKQHQSL